MATVALYARVSSAEQARGYSIDAQLDACRRFASDRGWESLEYVDPGRSGASESRPQFKQMIKDGLAGKFSVIIVHKFDRFARDRKISVVYKSLLAENGVKVVSVSQPVDDGPSGFLLEGITEVFDEFFRLNLKTEVVKSQARMINQGRWPGQPPRGYIRENGSVVLGSEANQFTLAFQEFATGEYTLREWADEAYERGMRLVSGGRIAANIWAAIFKNPFYKGVLRWKEMESTGVHEPIVDRETWDRVQQILSTNNGGRQTRTYRSYLLRGLLWSLDAASVMSGAVAYRGEKEYFYYRSEAKIPGGTRHHIPCDVVEAQVVSLMDNILISPHDVDGLDMPGLSLALRAASSVGAVYRQLEVEGRRELLCRCVASYGFRVSGSSIVRVEVQPPFFCCTPTLTRIPEFVYVSSER